ncbi:hypothetical protein [Aliamphritea spongicola]|nr:hypothetical protein [Aliamphritea spongicola]
MHRRRGLHFMNAAGQLPEGIVIQGFCQRQEVIIENHLGVNQRLALFFADPVEDILDTFITLIAQYKVGFNRG